MQVKQQEFPTFANVAFLDGSMMHHVQEMKQALTPCFQLLLYLQGRQEFYIDDVLFSIDAGQGEECNPKILLLNRTKQSVLRSVPGYGDQILKKVKVSVPADWARRFFLSDPNEALQHFLDGHINHCMWEASPAFQKIAQNIIELPPPFTHHNGTEISETYRLGKGLELLAMACYEMCETQLIDTPNTAHMVPSVGDKARRYILDNLDTDLSIDVISDQIGASRRSIQRNFKERFGITIFDFIRKHRLERARQAMEKEGYSVTQAAFLAHYRNSSSFTHAFKRVYGTSPKSWCL